ncbi:hypothetical protein, partial [Nostoc piscinale]
MRLLLFSQRETLREREATSCLRHSSGARRYAIACQKLFSRIYSLDLSGIPMQNLPPPSNMPDGRMYPPLDDYITRHP